jgi:diguanylate cyclase (GGDEF)-like protein
VDEQATSTLVARRNPRPHSMRGYGRPLVLLAGIWALGLIALGAVLVFEKRVDQTRSAQVTIADIRSAQGDLVSVAFSQAITGTTDPQSTARRLAQAKLAFSRTVARLATVGGADERSRIQAVGVRYFRFIDHVTALVSAGAGVQAALEYGQNQLPGGADAALAGELDRADARYGADAARSRSVASVGTVLAIVFLLAAFSAAFAYSVRARRQSHRDATTDALTGLGNRRKLFADMDVLVRALSGKQVISIGIFDLDGFKAYNDTFGHPAGDALLARLGQRLAASLGSRDHAYRIGGDEFVVTTFAMDGERVLEDARAALSERGADFSIGCSLGSARVYAGIGVEQALQLADQRLYANKRSHRRVFGSDAKDALLQVLTEQDANLVRHLGHVAELASLTAAGMQLTPGEVALTRLAAELHDVGKAAIPSSILDKAGPLDAAEREFVERHSAIGERIVAAAPSLDTIAPIVRATHERPDGTGYPDGLTLTQIPIAARIIAVVDAFDAMTSDRPYRKAIPVPAALAELRRHAGTQFDAAVVDVFAKTIEGRFTALRAA